MIGDIEMPLPKAEKIDLTDKIKHILTRFANSTHSPEHLKTRAQIILLASDGYSNNDIEKKLNMGCHRVKKWRDRFNAALYDLKQTELTNPQKLKSHIIEILSDEMRPGAPKKFTDDQFAMITLLSLQDPVDLNLPFSHWTLQLLKSEVVKRGIVDNISTSQLRRFFKRSRS
jgi:transposase